jgi:hypothetical protein
MNLSLYNLSYPTMINLMNLVDSGLITINSLPKRLELSEIHRFLKDYIKYYNTNIKWYYYILFDIPIIYLISIPYITDRKGLVY